MSDINQEQKHQKKETSGAWALLIFIGLFTLVIVMALLTR